MSLAAAGPTGKGLSGRGVLFGRTLGEQGTVYLPDFIESQLQNPSGIAIRDASMQKSG